MLRARRAVRLHSTVNVLVTSSAELRSLNQRFRGVNQATDVLSFPAEAEPAEQSQCGGRRDFCRHRP